MWLTLLFFSTPILLTLGDLTNIKIFKLSGDYNYLFTRLGNVLILFTLFIYLKKLLVHSIFIKIGKVTLSIYIVHHIILYGSWFNTGIYRWLNNSLSYSQAFIGALLFIILVCFIVLKYRTPTNQFANYIIKKIQHIYKTMRISYDR